MKNAIMKTVSLLLIFMMVVSCFSGITVMAANEDVNTKVSGSDVSNSDVSDSDVSDSDVSDSDVSDSDVSDSDVSGSDVSDSDVSDSDVSDSDVSDSDVSEITSVTVDTGNESDKTVVSCLGGSFTAVVTGKNLNHKIAVFSGENMVCKPVSVGSAEKSVETDVIEKGTFVLPANNTNMVAEYIIRGYSADVKDDEITSKTGTELAKVTVAAKSNTILVSPTDLTYTAEGSTKEISIHSNCELYVVASDSSWQSIGVKSVVDNKDGTLSTVLTITASKNEGLDREGSITISAKSDAKINAVVNIKQAGIDDADRIAGDDRVATAIEVSKSGWTSAETVILASGQSFADALAGVPLSAAADAPILLTFNKSSGVEQEVLDEITRLGAKKVYILGGTSAVCADTADKLEKAGLTVKRLAGEERYGTSVAIAEELYALTNKTFTKVYFTNAWNYPDALSVSSAAAIEGNPILYMPTTGAVEKYVSEYLKDNDKLTTGVILGGEKAVSKEGEESLTKLGLKLTRISGEDRYETSVKINEEYKSLFTSKSAAIATGEDFPDALAGGALCAKLKMPVVLVSDKYTDDALAYLKNIAPESLIIFGGKTVVSEELAVKLVSAV